MIGGWNAVCYHRRAGWLRGPILPRSHDPVFSIPIAIAGVAEAVVGEWHRRSIIGVQALDGIEPQQKNPIRQLTIERRTEKPRSRCLQCDPESWLRSSRAMPRPLVATTDDAPLGAPAAVAPEG